MWIISVILCLILLVAVFSFVRLRILNGNNVGKILTFILLFIGFYFVIAVISMVVFSMIFSNGNNNSDSGVWAYAIMLGMVLSPVLSLITTIKLNKGHTNVEDTINSYDKQKIQKNNKNPLLLLSILIVAFLSVGTFLFTMFNFNTRTLEEDVVYNIVYYDNFIPGAKYDITIYENKVEIRETSFCSAVDCTPTTTNESFGCSNEDVKKLKIFIANNFSSNYIELNDYELSDEQNEVIQGLLSEKCFVK